MFFKSGLGPRWPPKANSIPPVNTHGLTGTTPKKFCTWTPARGGHQRGEGDAEGRRGTPTGGGGRNRSSRARQMGAGDANGGGRGTPKGGGGRQREAGDAIGEGKPGDAKRGRGKSHRGGGRQRGTGNAEGERGVKGGGGGRQRGAGTAKRRAIPKISCARPKRSRARPKRSRAGPTRSRARPK